jgi:hypothetical protein
MGKNMQPSGPSLVYVAVLLIVVVSVELTGPLLGSTISPTYTVNGLTCPVINGDILSRVGRPYVITPVIQEVTQSPQFAAATEGLPYVLAGADNMTNGSQTYLGVTTRLPDRLELGFYTNGTSTTCITGPRTWMNSIDVQVPIINGSYNVAAESVYKLGGGPK